MLAAIIIGTTFVATSSSFLGSAQVYHYFADGPHEALMLAKEIHEAALLLPWESEPGAPALYGPEVMELWDLDGQEFAPPRSAKYELIVSHLEWSQEAEVYQVSMDDPTIVVEDPDEFEGDVMTEVKVRVYEGETFMGEFKWWITEPDPDTDA